MTDPPDALGMDVRRMPVFGTEHEALAAHEIGIQGDVLFLVDDLVVRLVVENAQSDRLDPICMRNPL